MPPIAPRLFVFDLDGTLVDSLQDIAESLNECLELLGLPMHPVVSYRYMVGEGVPTLCRRALNGAHPRLLDRLIELARARYRTRALRHTQPYEGVTELIAELQKTGTPMAVLSNKPHEMTRAIVEHFWGIDTFCVIQGFIAEAERKPDPTLLLRICERIGVAPAHATLVGDTPTDAETARRAGSDFVGVTWGFRTQADLAQAGATRFIDHPRQLLDGDESGGQGNSTPRRLGGEDVLLSH